MKKVHIGKNGKPRCVSRWSAHAKHRPSIVVPLDSFKEQPSERRCLKCAAICSHSTRLESRPAASEAV